MMNDKMTEKMSLRHFFKPDQTLILSRAVRHVILTALPSVKLNSFVSPSIVSPSFLPQAVISAEHGPALQMFRRGLQKKTTRSFTSIAA